MATALNRALTILAGALLGGGAVAVADCEAAGGWDLEVAWPQRTVALELAVGEDDGGSTVHWRGPQGELEGREVVCDGPSLSFVLEVRDRDDGTVRLSFEGDVEEDRLSGRLTTPRGLGVSVEGQRRDEEGAGGPAARQGWASSQP